MINLKFLVGLLLVLSFAQIWNCSPTFERGTKVKLEGGSRPRFILSGSGTLGALIVYGPRQRDIQSDRSAAVWEIQPLDGYMNGSRIESIGTIEYGVVPKGYKQIYPEDGGSPPELVPGQRYEYWFDAVGAPHARRYFELRDGKAVELPD